jgi:SulP family sulfate permease
MLIPEMADVVRVGAIPAVLPPFSLPLVPVDRLPALVSIAGALSIVALGQSVSIAKALAYRSGDHIDVDREFTGQGLSNLIGCFFSSYVSCGSLNRSVPNYIAGARTPMAAVFSAAFLVVLVFASRSLLERLPMPAIAALLVYIACGLIDVHRFERLARVSRAEFLVAIATLVGMLALPFQDAILIGSGLSLAVYLNRTAHPGVRTLLPDPNLPSRTFVPVEELTGPAVECPQLKLLRIEGSVYFGAASYVMRRLQAIRAAACQKHLFVMVKSMNFVDIAGAEVWEHELAARRAMGGDLYFHRPRSAVLKVWARTGFEAQLGADHIFASKATAVSAIYKHLDRDVCAHCGARVFRECEQFSGQTATSGQQPARAIDAQT